MRPFLHQYIADKQDLSKLSRKKCGGWDKLPEPCWVCRTPGSELGMIENK